MNTRVTVSALIEKEGQYLFGRKAPGIGPFPDKWLIPGGGINLGKETAEEALRREIREECNIEIKNLKKIMFHDGFGKNGKGQETYYVFLSFTADYASGEAKPGDDIVELKWTKRDELKNLDLSEPTVILFKRLSIL